MLFRSVCRENLLDSIWVDSLERKIQQYDNVVITDVRFVNEIKFLKSIGAIFVQIDREETRPEWYPHLVEHLKTNTNSPIDLSGIHRSEYDWFGNTNIDYIIKNDGSIRDLELKILDVIVNN